MDTKKERRALWAATLRSGEFVQTRGVLRRDDVDHDDDDPPGFCCLGVACELYRRETGLGHWTGDGWFMNTSTELPPDVKDWLGLATDSGWFEDERFAEYSTEDGRASLVALNDGYNRGEPVSFDVIADVIESEPEGLVKE